MSNLVIKSVSNICEIMTFWNNPGTLQLSYSTFWYQCWIKWAITLKLPQKCCSCMYAIVFTRSCGPAKIKMVVQICSTGLGFDTPEYVIFIYGVFHFKSKTVRRARRAPPPTSTCAPPMSNRYRQLGPGECGGTNSGENLTVTAGWCEKSR